MSFPSLLYYKVVVSEFIIHHERYFAVIDVIHFQFCSVGGGELFAFVSEREKLDEEEASGYMRQILEGVRCAVLLVSIFEDSTVLYFTLLRLLNSRFRTLLTKLVLNSVTSLLQNRTVSCSQGRGRPVYSLRLKYPPSVSSVTSEL